MLILISPAKTMREEGRQKPVSIPVLYEKSEVLLEAIRSYCVEDLMKLMKVKESIAKETKQKFQEMRFDTHGVCALESYDGIAFKSMKLDMLDKKAWEYLQQHLRILSGFYGMVKPMDSIYPYRMEMQLRFPVKENKHLYAFWNDTIAQACLADLKNHKEQILINLASKEYDKAILPYVDKKQVLTIRFCIEKDGVLKTESTQVKMARGLMVSYMAAHQVETKEEIKKFAEDGYWFEESISTEEEFVFVKRKD